MDKSALEREDKECMVALVGTCFMAEAKLKSYFLAKSRTFLKYIEKCDLLVELDDARLEVEARGLDLLGHERGILEGWVVAAGFFELQQHLAGAPGGEVGAALIAIGDESDLIGLGGGHLGLDLTADGGVEGTAQTAVGGDGQVELLSGGLSRTLNKSYSLPQNGKFSSQYSDFVHYTGSIINKFS